MPRGTLHVSFLYNIVSILNPAWDRDKERETHRHKQGKRVKERHTKRHTQRETERQRKGHTHIQGEI